MARLGDFIDPINRGFYAGTLGAPVDLANLLANLARAGVGYIGGKTGLLSADQLPPLVDKPVGGSEWIGEKMQQAGLLSAARNAPLEMAGGLLAPIARANSARVRAGLLTALDNAHAPKEAGFAAGQRGAMYYRNTRGQSPLNKGGADYAMFADDPERIASYGHNKWIFNSDSIPAADVFDVRVPDNRRALAAAMSSDRRALREAGASPRVIMSESNPNDIVNSAGMWDNQDWAGLAWRSFLEHNGYRAVVTENGAVVFDPSLIAKRFSLE